MSGGKIRVSGMAQFESSIKQIPYPQQAVYNMLSDLSNIERIKDKIPEDNERFEVEAKGYEFKVLSVKNKTVRTVLVIKQ